MSVSSYLENWANKNSSFVFSLLRNIKPNLVYKNVAIITRYKDVQEALSRPDILSVTYAEKMAKITNGSNFFLGMDNTPDYTRDVSNMRIAVRRSDISTLIAPKVNEWAEELVQQAEGQMDLVTALTSVVPCRLSESYLGIKGLPEHKLFTWTTNIFQYLFNANNTEEQNQTALADADNLRHFLDKLIDKRQVEAHNGDYEDDILGRCLELQASDTPGMTSEDIRNNLMGLLIGLIPATSKCAILMLDYLLDHPDLLAGAQKAAKENDDALLKKYMLESLRLNVFNKGLIREAKEDYIIAKGTLRAKKIPKGSKILVSTQSAMLDASEIPDPKAFKLNRPEYHYMHFGYGIHTCLGQYINMVQIPAIAKAILRCEHLQRASGKMGQVAYDEHYPMHLHVKFTPVNSNKKPETDEKNNKDWQLTDDLGLAS